MRFAVLNIAGSVAVMLFGSVYAAFPYEGRLLESAAEMASETPGADSSERAAFPADEVIPEQLGEFGRGLEGTAGGEVAGTCNPFDLCGDPDCEPWCNPVCSAFDPCRCGGCAVCPCMSACSPQCNPICPQFDLCACNGRCSALCPTAACDPACVNPACVPVCPQFNPCACLGPCDPTCPTALCNAQCGTHPECNPVCGGNPCNSGCSTFCTCPQNLCSGQCGDPDCNVLCGGSLCALDCDDARCTAACPENLACQSVCGGDPCSEACWATQTGRSMFCDATICPTNYRCSPLCSETSDTCATGCPLRCIPGLCTENVICDRECGGDPCGAECASYGVLLGSQLDLFCDASLCPENDRCNLLCGGDPCDSGCPDTCDRVLCPESACETSCGGDPCSAACAASLSNFDLFCDPVRCPENALCNTFCDITNVLSSACITECGGDPCSELCSAAEGYFTFSYDEFFCNPTRCSYNARCNLLCGGDPCDLRCADACTVLCPTNLNCVSVCGGDPENFGCPELDCDEDPCQPECIPECDYRCPEYDFCTCSVNFGPSHIDCNPICGGHYCNPGCPAAETCLCKPCGADCDPRGCLESDCNQNATDDAFDVSRFDQWANRVLAFSAQWSDFDWAALQALGPPDTSDYCDCSTAWAVAPINGTREFLLLGFAEPVHASGVTIHENLGHGFVYQIDLLDTDGAFHTVFTGVDPSTPLSAYFVVPFAPTSYLAQGVKIYVDTDSNLYEWEEIDAVRLHAQYPDARSLDTNLDGVPDECQFHDCDGNGFVEVGDWGCIAHCIQGPDQSTPYGCNHSDVNGDYDVDLDDVARYLNTLTLP